MKPVRVALCGVGTVGSGVLSVLTRNRDEITRRVGRPIEITVAVDRDVARVAALVQGRIRVTDDALAVAQDPDIDVVIELIGGSTIARQLILAALASGKHVVTANKALLATQGHVIFEQAAQAGVMVAFEAAVAGGIPIIKALREGLTANRLEWVAGIINGTTNFILTQMREQGWSFDAALQEAQRLGYAEADPTFDIEGVDAAHKITLLASLAFGIPVQFDRAYVEGISALAAQDLKYAASFGYRVKLLGIARRTAQGVELRVHPTLIPETHLLASVNGVMNAVLVKGDAVGQTLYYGAGAGSEPTASAVIADVIDVVRQMATEPALRVPYLAFQAHELSAVSVLSIEDVTTSYYVRLCVVDRPGVLADLTRILGDFSISIEAMLQSVAAEGMADLVMLTHDTTESRLRAAIQKIEALDAVSGQAVVLRRELLV